MICEISSLPLCDLEILPYIGHNGGILFSLSLPKAPAALNADTMTDEQFHAALQAGVKEVQNIDTVCGE